MRSKYLYNTNLAKGTGFVNETLELLSFVEEEDDKKSFLDRCVTLNLLGKSTEKRTKDIISLVFFNRYWKEGLPQQLQAIRESGLGLEGMKQLFLVYTARANPIFKDFIIQQVANKRNYKISNQDSLTFINDAISIGNAPSWSDSMKKRVSSYLVSSCRDFSLIDSKGKISLFYPEGFVVNYFLHELHFSEIDDNQILNDDTWSILQLSKNETLREIEKISFTGSFIYQYSGELLRISWKYKNMNEFIKNECR
ncbi:BrxA family protein [Gaetbulibacter saemankumensis]|uniref:BrxA family protein n=1 Tax=Gaetbulibacter saemankumensis TaxID=311208 RepID=UPI0004008609|nr:BrxA family protein [Gaetbulibacter saemankumensis]